MSAQLLEIQPRELNFLFELKKQSSCSVRLTNNTYQTVAFKVKTTSPKKYCVRPNVGIVMPKSTCDFSVTMQAQKVAPHDMVCKDKFLIQSIVVPDKTTEEDITASLFAKGDGSYIEETKLRVILVSPPHSPVLSPINGTLKQGSVYEAFTLKDHILSGPEVLTEPHLVIGDVETKVIHSEKLNPSMDAELKPEMDAENKEVGKDAGLKLNKDVTNIKDLKSADDSELSGKEDIISDTELKTLKEDMDFSQTIDAEFKTVMPMDFKTAKIVEELNLAEDIEEMKLKLSKLESKLNEAEATILKLTDERRLSIQETKILQEELEILRRGTGVRKVQVGFPLLFVCMVALINLLVGYLLHC
ncbi:vesicle-associated protein 1-2-like [Tripterygium wilfordii]|uniref:vesicle-associated protein 1-2-like n=1 Tax=Tripterygium wilfordii TaxID=458696 RepID=UPI0018F7E5AD|nr:vesicle-associated protein 1-2-like [Tripterygium wilfordii]XP_038705284.1 vesicle-associated protein 1-2-like [Tripterygium wilfordii]XP_038705285.1 vesicle-associated protein 1-2-like [Tripterygium wilfordii]XP_038705286.1 vesicle-associated protein 1-2-like [Tripterygium wilfordii]